jgi:hypothetical protein
MIKNLNLLRKERDATNIYSTLLRHKQDVIFLGQYNNDNDAYILYTCISLSLSLYIYI